MERAFRITIESMLPLGFFALAFFAVIGGVCWACMKDTDQT
jgi:hypothetical protein